MKDRLKFENVFLDIEYMLMRELNEKLNTNLQDGSYSLHEADINWIDKDVHINGFDRTKGVDFMLYYNFELKAGNIFYFNGDIYMIN